MIDNLNKRVEKYDWSRYSFEDVYKEIKRKLYDEAEFVAFGMFGKKDRVHEKHCEHTDRRYCPDCGVKL